MKKNFTKLNISIFSFLLLVPWITFAQQVRTFNTLFSLIFIIVNLLRGAIFIVAALALLFFFWGLAMFILGAGNEDKRTQGKHIMLWGIIALFVMVSVWGIVRVLQNTFL